MVFVDSSCKSVCFRISIFNIQLFWAGSDFYFQIMCECTFVRVANVHVANAKFCSEFWNSLQYVFHISTQEHCACLQRTISASLATVQQNVDYSTLLWHIMNNVAGVFTCYDARAFLNQSSTCFVSFLTGDRIFHFMLQLYNHISEKLLLNILQLLIRPVWEIHDLDIPAKLPLICLWLRMIGYCVN